MRRPSVSARCMAPMPAASASKQRYRLRVRRERRPSCCSVRAVPMLATTLATPAWARAMHVGVALDHVDAVLLARRRLGLVEAEQGLALVVERRLRRVEVLGLLVAQRAGAEAERAPALVAEREHDAAAEAVVGAAALAGDHEPGVEQVLLAEPLGEGGVAQLLPARQAVARRGRRGRPRPRGRAASRYSRAGAAALASW